MFDGSAKREKKRERRTNSRSQARGAICLMGEEDETTNKQQNRAKRQRLLLELKGNGQFARARETRGKRRTNKTERTNKQETENHEGKREEKRDIDEPILRCSEGGVRAQGQSTFATRHSFPLRTVRRANVA